MKFSPKTDEDIKRAMLLDAGSYDFEVLSAEEKLSKKGNPMIVVKLLVFAGERRREVTDYLMESMAFKLRHFAFAVGLGKEYESGDLNAENFRGRSGKVVLAVEEQVGYSPKNVVRDYEVAEGMKEAATAAAKPRAAAPVDDEPPF